MAKDKKKKAAPKKPIAPYAAGPSMVNNLATTSTARYEDVCYEYAFGAITKVQSLGSQRFQVIAEGRLALQIEVWSERCIRFRYGLDGLDSDFSYAIDPAAKLQATEVSLSPNKKGWLLQTSALACQLEAATGQLPITDRKSGKVVHAYAAPVLARTTLLKGLDQLRLQLKTDKKEGFFGLGDKSWHTDLQGRCFQNWCTDSFGYHLESDALYRAIPFYMGLRKGLGYGLFLDNTFRTHFDFNSLGDGKTTLWADGGELNYYFFLGPQLDTVAADYASLTGKPELPPLWALGFHQCRWSYYPEARVREIASTFREKQIPCDAIYLDIDYMDGYRCFTWNKEHFPQPKEMMADLRQQGFHTVVMIDPGIKVDPDYDVYQSGTEIDAWCKRRTGEDMVGPVWPPECVWPDYTKPQVRDWWGMLYQELYLEQGVSGFWNDMNEPAVFKVNHMTFPDDVIHDFEGRWAEHKEAHNIYGMQMARATYEGLKKLNPAKRPFLLGRANYSGGQRYAALWTGDNVASWEHLAMANRQCIRLSISGYSFVGTDIGGFVDEPDGELMVRWLQLGIFHPLMRVHSMGNNVDGAAEAEADLVKAAEANNRQDQEPWVYGAPYTELAKQAIEFRYRLLPYLYTAFEQHIRTGQPLLRNLFFYDQKDENCRKYGDQFFCGKDLLVAPVLKKGAKSSTVYLPKGEWVEWKQSPSGESVFVAHAGARVATLRHKLGEFPLFVRKGAILPSIAPVQYTGQIAELKQLALQVFLGPKNGAGRLYWDSGEGYGYEKGHYIDCEFSYRMSKSKIVVAQLQIGRWKSPFKTIRLQLIGSPALASTALVDGRVVPIHHRAEGSFVEVPFDFIRFEVALLKGTALVDK